MATPCQPRYKYNKVISCTDWVKMVSDWPCSDFFLKNNWFLTKDKINQISKYDWFGNYKMYAWLHPVNHDTNIKEMKMKMIFFWKKKQNKKKTITF